MSTELEKIFVVDRIEGRIAVLVLDSGEQRAVPIGDLPVGVSEGTVLRVPLNESGVPSWTAAQIDEEEEERRRQAAQTILDELRKRDPGGDITL